MSNYSESVRSYGEIPARQEFFTYNFPADTEKLEIDLADANLIEINILFVGDVVGKYTIADDGTEADTKFSSTNPQNFGIAKDGKQGIVYAEREGQRKLFILGEDVEIANGVEVTKYFWK